MNDQEDEKLNMLPLTSESPPRLVFALLAASHYKQAKILQWSQRDAPTASPPRSVDVLWNSCCLTVRKSPHGWSRHGARLEQEASFCPKRQAEGFRTGQAWLAVYSRSSYGSHKGLISVVNGVEGAF